MAQGLFIASCCAFSLLRHACSRRKEKGFVLEAVNGPADTYRRNGIYDKPVPADGLSKEDEKDHHDYLKDSLWRVPVCTISQR